MFRSIAFFLICILMLCGCGSRKQLAITTEHLDLNKIQSLIPSNVDNNHSSRITKNDTLTEVFISGGSSITYSIKQTDLKKGDVVFISGNENIGYSKWVFNINKPLLEKKTYYSTGQLKSLHHFYSEKSLVSGASSVEYPIKVDLYYDAQGKLVSSFNNDNFYNISFNEIKAIIRETATDGKITQAELNQYMDGAVLWKIHYVSKEYGLSSLNVDAITGNILSHSHNIKLIDN